MKFGGAERVVNTLLWNLRDDFDIHLVLYNHDVDFELPPDITVFDLKETRLQSFLKSFFRLPSVSYKLYRYCKANDIQLSVGFLNRPCYANALMRTLCGFKGRIVLSERTHQTTMLNGNSTFYRVISSFLVKFAYKRADLIIANAHAIRSDLIANFSVKTPITVIQNPVDIDNIRKQMLDPIDLQKEPGIFYFVAVGGYRKEKNYNLLLESLALLKTYPIKLILVGGGELQEEIDQKIKQLGLEENVIQTGIASNPYKYIYAADAMVISSYVEGFPNVLLEGLACGKPVVSTDCKSGPREILHPESDFELQVSKGIEYAQYGILTAVDGPENLASGMEKMFHDKNLRESYTALAAKRAADFSIAETCKQYANAFRDTSIRQAE